jgi:hypothetical protein
LLDLKIIGKTNNSSIKFPKKYLNKSEIMKTIEPTYHREPQLNIFNDKELITQQQIITVETDPVTANVNDSFGYLENFEDF